MTGGRPMTIGDSWAPQTGCSRPKGSQQTTCLTGEPARRTSGRAWKPHGRSETSPLGSIRCAHLSAMVGPDPGTGRPDFRLPAGVGPKTPSDLQPVARSADALLNHRRLPLVGAMTHMGAS
ncbi:hypothetical protein AVEN_119341-1 [Araneus ventricosus]|uniref:Uncharacterized protein n=1 Tax=Araneus ventricosus TaxID=182803 RepID=A0A4Y2PZ17_ARAVE|nr:hypothetical protein AVEN_119341-1 [Araneus ventricosus]